MSAPAPGWLEDLPPGTGRWKAEARFQSLILQIWHGSPTYSGSGRRFSPSNTKFPRGSIARIRLLIRTAALYHNSTGSMRQLSEACGMHPRTLATYSTSRTHFSPTVAKRIAQVVGKDILSREVLAPEVFDD